MTTPEIALLSSCIGASAGLISQFIANGLRDKSDKKKMKIDLVAEERKLAYMILLNQISYVQVGITIEYYFQLAVLTQEKENISLQRHHDEIKYSNTLHAEYTSLVGDYCRNVYKIMHYLKHAAKLENIMQNILNEAHEDFTGMFNNIADQEKLFETYHKEHQLASVKLETYRSYFDEMRRSIAKVS